MKSRINRNELPRSKLRGIHSGIYLILRSKLRGMYPNRIQGSSNPFIPRILLSSCSLFDNKEAH